MIALPSFALAAALWAAPGPVPQQPADQPGPETESGYRLLQADQKEEACAHFVTQIREGTQDPWAFTFVLLEGCLKLRSDHGEAFRESLTHRRDDDILAVLGRGILHASRSELVEAEVLFRQVVARAPERAPGWILLGWTLVLQEEYRAGLEMLDEALRRSPDSHETRKLRQIPQMVVGSFDRLESLLVALPERWAHLPEPRVPISGRRRREVLADASPSEVNRSRRQFGDLFKSLPDQREEMLRKLWSGTVPTELDLWVPSDLMEMHFFIDLAQKGDTEGLLQQGARAAEAWLQWSETLGHREGLLYAAISGIQLLERQGRLSALDAIVRKWSPLISQMRSDANDRFSSFLRLYIAATLVRVQLYEIALPILREEQSIQEKARHPSFAAKAWIGEGEIWWLQRKYPEALHAYDRAREIAASAERSSDRYLAQAAVELRGSAILAAANIHSQLLDNERALAEYREARPLLEASGDLGGQGDSWVGEGLILARLQRYDEALAAYAKARPLLEAGHDEQGLGNGTHGEAEILRVRGDNETALRKYREARDHFAAAGDEVGLGNAWLGEAGIRGQMGYSEIALKMLEEARAHSEKGQDQGGVGNAWLTEADHRQWLEEDEQALRAYREARRHHEAVGDRAGLGHGWIGEGEVLARLGDPQGALTAYRKALELAPDDPRTQGYAALGEAKVLARQGRWREAAEEAASAARFFLLDPPYPRGRIESLLVEEEVLQEMGDWDRAAAVAEEVLQAHSAWRQTRITDAHRTEEDVQIARVYDLLIPLRVHQGRDREALTLAEESRSRVLLDLLATRSRGPQFRPSPSLREEKLRLLKERARLELEIAQASDPLQRSELEMERRRVDKELEWNGYEQAAEGSALLTSQPLNAEAIQALSREIKSPILLYYVGAGDVFGFLVRPDRAAPVVEAIAIPWRQMTSKAQALASNLANPVYQDRPEAKALARELWDRLIQPFVPYLPPERGPLVLVPHGPLHELPFEALLDPYDISLFRFWDVTVVPSVSALSLRRQRRAGPPAEEALLTFSSGRGLSLPEHEVARIAPFFHTVRPTEPLFSRYEEAAPGARYLFFATHGIHVENDQSETYLELLPGEDHDSRLSAAEIAAIPLQAELVTLAACDTSHGTPLFSDERLGLTRSFLIAGAAAVLATRWKMPEDSTTSRFLEDFFRAYRQGGPDGKGLRKDQALSEARRLSRQRGDPAQLWAGWVLVGDPR